MKRIFLCLLCIAFFALPLAGACAEPQSQISPCVVPDIKVSATIKLSGSSVIGTAIVTASPVLTVTTTVNLEQNIDGEWDCVSTSIGGSRVTATVLAESNTSYRAYIVCVAKDSAGHIVDTLTCYSNTLVV